MTYYATNDAEDGIIAEDAHIAKFATMAEAEAYLRAGYDPAEWTVEIKVGGYSDCWIKSQAAPKVGEHWIAPFSRAQLYVQRPGQHPGGKAYWTTPKPDVLVVVARPVED